MSTPIFDAPISLPATRRLFQSNAYLRQAEAEVIHSQGHFVVLDQTVFYGESGGQEWDEGLIGGLAVVNVQHHGGEALASPPIHARTTIVHQLSEPAPFKIGDRVRLSLDWARRYANMRQHSACHFMYAALQSLWGGPPGTLPSRGCHIRPDAARMDFGADLTDEVVDAAQAYANALIGEGLPIEMVALGGDVFEWRYGGLIPVPCGGTHCQSATELGPIQLKRKRKGVGITRVTTTFA